MTTITTLRKRPPPSQPHISDGRPTEAFSGFLQSLDAFARAFNGDAPLVLTNAANDGAAAAAGVPLFGLYRNGNVVQIRIV